MKIYYNAIKVGHQRINNCNRLPHFCVSELVVSMHMPPSTAVSVTGFPLSRWTLPRALLALGFSAFCTLQNGYAQSMPPFRVVAGILPPFAVENGEGAPGAMVELVEQLIAESKNAAKVEFVPWQRAVYMSLKLPRIAVLPLTRTVEREGQYRWLARLHRQHFIFVGKQYGAADVLEAESLKGKRIAVLRGSPHYSYLLHRGFKNVFEASSAEEMHRLLDRGIADILFGSEVVHKTALRLRAHKGKGYAFSPSYYSGDIWLAGSLDFTEQEAAVLQAAMRTLVENGTYSRLMEKYHLTD
jgi:polar amino acid transport system substrate-binding protein